MDLYEKKFRCIECGFSSKNSNTTKIHIKLGKHDFFGKRKSKGTRDPHVRMNIPSSRRETYTGGGDISLLPPPPENSYDIGGVLFAF